MIEKIKKYLTKNRCKIGCIFSFDKNENEYAYEFFTFTDADGSADSKAWSLEIRKMEDVGTMELSPKDAVENYGLKEPCDFYNHIS